MSDKSLVDALLDLPDEDARQSLLEARRDELTDEVYAELEDLASRWLQASVYDTLRAADVMLQIASLLGDERGRANALRLKGNSCVNLGRFQESLAHYGAAREIRARLGDSLEIARLQVGWTAALKDLARYDEALQLGLATREILVEHKKWDWLAVVELNIGNIYRLIDRHDEALAMYEQGRQHFMQTGDLERAAYAGVTISRVLLDQNCFREALSLLRQARLVFEGNEMWLSLAAITDLDLAVVYFRLGRYREAWDDFAQAREMFRRLNDEMNVAIVDLYCSRLYLSLNLFPEALDLATSARAIFVKNDMARHVVLASFSQAIAYRGLGEVEQALRLFQETRDFFVAHKGASWAALVDLERTALLRESGQAEDALALAEGAASVFSQCGLVVRQDQAWLLMAECHSDLGQSDQALPLYEAILNAPPEQRLPTLGYRACYGLGRVEEARDRMQTAYQHYQAAIDEIEIIRRSLRVDEFKASFLDDKLALYQAAVRLSLEMGNLEAAFDYVERSKSSALLDLLARDLDLRAAGGEAVNPEAWERLRELKEEWLWHYTKLQELPGSEDHVARSAARDNSSWAMLKQIEAQYSQVLRQLQGHQYSSLVESDERSWKAIGRYLQEDTLLIEYFCIGDEILAFLFSADGLEVQQDFPCSLREVQRSLDVLSLALKGVSGLDPIYINEVLHPLAQRHLAWLYVVLVAPLADFIGAYRKLVIVPHDILYYLPFHAFHDGERYLVDRFQIQYAPSASVLERCYQKQSVATALDKARPALIMGYSDGGRLRYVCDEVQAVATALGNGSSAAMDLIFEEEAATLARLRQQANGCRLLHLASHGVFRADNPLFSFIKLADEPLNVIDIYGLSLNASLVTLSACETGVSQLKGGDLFGLARGCLYAGAPALVVSLWQVDDASTALLMRKFYQRLEAGDSMSDALRAAQLALRQVECEHQGRRIRPYEHPHYWAPFFLIGADGAL